MILLFLTFRFTSWPVPVPIRPVCQFMDTTGGLLSCPPEPSGSVSAGWNAPNAVLPMHFFYPPWFPSPRFLFPNSKGSAMTTKKDAASAWSVKPIHPLMKTTSNPYSETTGSAGEKNCVLSGSASFHWTLWSFPVSRIIRRSSCRYTGGSTGFFPIPHSLTWQCLCCFLQ